MDREQISTHYIISVYTFALERTRIYSQNVCKYTSFILLHRDLINQIQRINCRGSLAFFCSFGFILGAKYTYYS